MAGLPIPASFLCFISMLTSTAHVDMTWWEPYTVGINMVLLTVFKFQELVERQEQENKTKIFEH